MLSLRAQRSNLDRPDAPGPGLLRRAAPRNDARSRIRGKPANATVSVAVRSPLALPLKRLGDLEGEFERLAGVEPRVAMRQVIGAEALLAELLGAADAFGDVLAGQLEMHPAGVAALGEMDREGAVHLVEDAVEHPCLVAGRRGDRVAVHRVDAPHDLASLALHRADQRR